MIPRSFYFLRHGETDWNKEHRLQGFVDVPLNCTGREQARQAVPFLRSQAIDRIFSSPLKRALETACIINEILRKPLETDDRLKEKHFGLYEGKTKEDIEKWKLENLAYSFIVEQETGSPRPPEGETYQSFHGRIFDFACDVLNRFPDENILFVAHGGVYRALCRALALEVNQSPNAQPFLFKRENSMEWALHILKE